MKLLSITLTLILTLNNLVWAQTEQPDTLPIKIIELQLGSETSASEEFVELYNTSSAPIEIDGITIQYKSKSGSSWSTKATLAGWVAPYGRYLVSNYLVTSSSQFNGGLSGSSGHLRLADSNDFQIDLVAWGGAIEPEVQAVETHQPGQSLKRLVDEDGRFVDTDNNFTDWFASDSPTPEFDLWVVEEVADPVVSPVDPEPEVEDPDPVISDPIVIPPPMPVSAQLNITELMPDPSSPLTDAEHEFIEVYNPNNFAVSLAGYEVQTGSEWRYRYVIEEYSLQPAEYIAIFAADSGLKLTNSGSQVRLLGADGRVLAEVVYEKAVAGQSWSIFSDGWAWAEPTPNANNLQYVTPQTETTDEEGIVLSAIDKREIDFPSTDSKQSSLTSQQPAFQEPEEQETKVNNTILAGVGVIAVLYALYEYRNEIRIRLQQCRRYIEVRRENRKKTEGRRSDRIAQRYRRWQNDISAWFGQRRRQQ